MADQLAAKSALTIARNAQLGYCASGKGDTSADEVAEMNARRSVWITLVGTAAAAIIAVGCTREPDIGCSPPPHPRSEEMGDVLLHLETWRTEAKGSDLWPLTWSDDDHQYTSWGDGTGFGDGGDGPPYRVENGIARVTGNHSNYTGVNIYGGKNPEVSTYSYKGWVTGILSVRGVLYALANEVYDNNNHWWEAGILVSEDHGRSWEFPGWDFDATSPRGFAQGTFLQAGRDFSDAQDDYVYIVAQAKRPSVFFSLTDGVDLARVLSDRVTDREAYEFFLGLTDDGQPKWTSDITQRRPAFTWKGKIPNIVSISYVPALSRYILYFPASGTDGRTGLAVFDARKPWGPWTSVKVFCRLGSKDDTWSFHLAPKWWRDGGKKFTLVFTSDDSWNTVDGNFVLGTTATRTSTAPN